MNNKNLKQTPSRLRSEPIRSKGLEIGVDRENKVLRGYVVAQEGPFKSVGRGEFDRDAIRSIADMINTTSAGLKARFTHPTLSEDGLGKFLGRSKDARVETITTEQHGTVLAARADLHFDQTAFDTPSGDLATYVMDLAESDSDAISSSLVLSVDEEYRLDKKGRPLTDDEGNELPPLWRPTKLYANDIVEEGDAVDGLLSSGVVAQALSGDELSPELLRFDNVARLGSKLLDGMFAGAEEDVIRARCEAWLSRYLAHRFPKSEPEPTPILDEWSKKLEGNLLTIGRQSA